MTDVELLPLPEPFVSDLMHGDLYTPEQVRAYARANIAQQPAAQSGEAVACCNMVDYFNARACEKCSKVIEGWVFGDASPQQRKD